MRNMYIYAGTAYTSIVIHVFLTFCQLAKGIKGKKKENERGIDLMRNMNIYETVDEYL